MRSSRTSAIGSRWSKRRAARFCPGGGIDPGEWAEITAVRETREECALDIRTTWFVGRATDLVVGEEEGHGFEKVSAFLAADVIGRAAIEPQADHTLIWAASGEDAARTLTRQGHIWAIEEWQRARTAWPEAHASYTVRGDADA